MTAVIYSYANNYNRSHQRLISTSCIALFDVVYFILLHQMPLLHLSVVSLFALTYTMPHTPLCAHVYY